MGWLRLNFGKDFKRRTVAGIAIFAFFINTPTAEAKLSRSEIALLDAFAFVMMDLEEGLAPEAMVPVKRNIKDSSVEFFISGQIPNSSDNKLYGVWLELSSPEECVFVINTRMTVPPEILKKNGQMMQGEATGKYDLNRMTKFEIRKFPLNPTVTFFGVSVEGTQIYCEKGQCRDKNVMNLTQGYNRLNTPALQNEFLTRHERAIEFIKKSCPGKPY